jgi:purine nucleosidase
VVLTHWRCAVCHARPELELLGANVCRLLQWCQHPAVPVVLGARQPLVTEYRGQSGILVHGDDGLGNLHLPPLSPEALRPMTDHSGLEAHDFIIDTCCRRFPGQVTLITLGPLTNIALAVQKEPALAHHLKELVTMGGSFSGRGNKTPVAEANIGNDPEAAHRVCQAFPTMVLASLDVTRQLSLHALVSRVATLNAAGRFIAALTRHYIATLASWGEKDIAVHDPSAVMAVLRYVGPSHTHLTQSLYHKHKNSAHTCTHTHTFITDPHTPPPCMAPRF